MDIENEKPIELPAKNPVNVTENETVNDNEEKADDSAPDMFDQIEIEAGESTESEDQPGVETAQIAAGAFATTFGLIAPAWQVSNDECHALGEAWSPIIDKYMPGVLNSMFGAAIATTALVLGSRLGKPRKFSQKPKKPEKTVNDKPVQNQQSEEQKNGW